MLDTNVFVSAIKNPARETSTFRLIISLIQHEDMRLIGDDILAFELLRYAQEFPSPTAAALVSAIIEKMDIVRVEDRFILACLPHFPSDQAADCTHAAACLQTGATLISNDRHFDGVRKAGIVQVLTTSEAIRRWTSHPRQ